MSRIYINNNEPKFLFFTNYKVMNSNLARIIREAFPEIKVSISSETIRDISGYVKIAIVRNPFDRIFSLFMDKCRAHPFKVRNREDRIFLQKCQMQILSAYSELQGRSISIIPYEKEIRKNSHDYWLLLENFKQLEEIRFEEFVFITKHLMDQEDVDAHFHPQSRIMSIEGKLIIDKYFKLENIDNEWPELCQIISANLILQRGSNRTNFEGPKKYIRYYTNEMQDIISSLYYQDINNFGYSFHN